MELVFICPKVIVDRKFSKIKKELLSFTGMNQLPSPGWVQEKWRVLNTNLCRDLKMPPFTGLSDTTPFSSFRKPDPAIHIITNHERKLYEPYFFIAPRGSCHFIYAQCSNDRQWVHLQFRYTLFRYRWVCSLRNIHCVGSQANTRSSHTTFTTQ